MDELHLKNKVVCADAMQTQRDFCIRVLSGGGDYLLFAKKNQATLLADIQQLFVPPRQAVGWHIPHLPGTTATFVNKAYGRLEQRTLTLMADGDEFVDWPGLKQVFKLERYTKKLSTGVEKTEIVYGLTSCPADRVEATQLLEWTRAYWQIENGLHYRRDATLNEDRTRISNTDFGGIIKSCGLANKKEWRILVGEKTYKAVRSRKENTPCAKIPYSLTKFEPKSTCL